MTNSIKYFFYLQSQILKKRSLSWFAFFREKLQLNGLD